MFSAAGQIRPSMSPDINHNGQIILAQVSGQPVPAQSPAASSLFSSYTSAFEVEKAAADAYLYNNAVPIVRTRYSNVHLYPPRRFSEIVMKRNPEMKESPEYAALTSFVSSSSTTSLDSAVASLIRPTVQAIESGSKAEDIEESLWSIWDDLVTVASKIPHDDNAGGQGRLVQLVERIAQLPAPKPADGADEGIRVWDLNLWSDLPVFGATMRERWNFEPQDSSTPHEIASFINLNAFAARLTASATRPPYTPAQPSRSLDFSIYAIWTLRSALEDAPPSSSTTASAHARAAAVWGLYAADELWAMVQADRKFEGRIAIAGSGPNVNSEWRGFECERYQFWLARLRDLGAMDALNDTDGARDLVMRAVQRMEEAQK